MIVWIAVTLAFFALALLPGDAIESQLAQSGVPADLIAERRAASGLNDPLGVRYFRYILNAIQGNLGVSLLSGEPVTESLMRSIPPTFTLAAPALVVACASGILLGIASTMPPRLMTAATGVMINLALSMPIYWTGTLAIYLLTVHLDILPSTGAGNWTQLVLPVAVLGFHAAGAIARATQNNVREVINADFVRTARAKGLHEARVMGVHVLRVALPPILGVMALQGGFLFSGTVITESLFVRPGIGRLLLDAVLQQDSPVVLGVVALTAGIYVIVSLIADIGLRILDPRVAL
jgi:peptide/nickel transport system permease protein